MQLVLYPKLSTRSRRAILKTKGKFGRAYYYSPRFPLIQRLSQETGMSIEQVYRQISIERRYLLQQRSE